MSTSAPTLNFCGVLSESKRIINAHSRHFLALSVLFILPLSFSLIMYPTLEQTLFQSSPRNSKLLLQFTDSHTSHHNLQTLAFPLLYTLFLFLFSLFALASITYSTFHGFYGRPVKIASAIKSLFYSFLPLLATSFVSHMVIGLICAGFALVVFSMIKGVEFLGFEIDYDSNYFAGVYVVALIFYLVVLVYLQVNWALAFVIVVVESKWGLEPLRRSTYLVRGMRGVSLSLFLFFGALIGVLVWSSAVSAAANLSGVTDGWKSWAFIGQIVVSSSFLTMAMLHNVAANTVLYMYCKAIHGELAWEIAEEFARDYISLPFDDEKVPHVVSVVQA
ncbi:uncharacterized protein LOC132294825 [Cornus florida]|uniref:uncharacterized protein LOC132294825 n=1 Tax=Cornus florida TaxID=4283 RepID=UPI00289AFE1B|nr:uncharacterized protein LOC132294825 [Cornus florida]